MKTAKDWAKSETEHFYSELPDGERVPYGCELSEETVEKIQKDARADLEKALREIVALKPKDLRSYFWDTQYVARMALGQSFSRSDLELTQDP